MKKGSLGLVLERLAPRERMDRRHTIMSKSISANKDSDQRVTVRLSDDLKQKVDNLFVDLPNDSEKVRYILAEYFKFIEKYPYLNVSKETLSPSDAGFPPCDLVKPLYDEKGESIGFICLLRRPLLNLPRIKVGRLTFNATSTEICWGCVEIGKKMKLGVDPFSRVTLEAIREHKEKYKPDPMRVMAEGGRGAPKINREEAFKLFALNRPKLFMKRQLHIAEASWWRLKREYEALSLEEKEKIVKSVANYL
jgi:hypothetical protein